MVDFISNKKTNIIEQAHLRITEYYRNKLNHLLTFDLTSVWTQSISQKLDKHILKNIKYKNNYKFTLKLSPLSFNSKFKKVR